MASTTNNEIAQLRARLAEAEKKADDREKRLNELATRHENTKAGHVACVQQLARAFTHLQNVYLADQKPGTHNFDPERIGAWLNNLESTIPETEYKYVLDRSVELDKGAYGTKNQQASVADVRPSQAFQKTGFRASDAE